MEKVPNPHDKFIKEILGSKEIARDFLKNYIPENVRDLINLDDIRISKDSFIEKANREYRSDLLYEVGIGDETGYVYFLFEHKSYSDKKTVLQLLNYMLKIWNLHWRQSPGDPLPIIIPVLIYHGTEKWKYGADLHSHVSCPKEELKVYVPDFQFILDDLTVLTEEELKGLELLRAAIMMLKYIKRTDFVPRLKKILRLLKSAMESRLEEDWFIVFIQYIFSVRDDLQPEELKKLVEKNISADKGGELMSIAEQLMEKGRKEGIEEGRKEGNVGMVKENTIDVLEARFGRVPSQLIEKINAVNDLAFLKSLHKKSIFITTLHEIEEMFE